MEKVVYTVEEVGKMLGISRTKAYEFVKKELPIVKVGRCVRVPANAFERWLNEQIAY